MAPPLPERDDGLGWIIEFARRLQYLLAGDACTESRSGGQKQRERNRFVSLHHQQLPP
ncbi:hypothetical protein PAHAL_2G384600 [Panicum hallii]|uniref:Uncharacterized protein n=1 Tax=Panicum hallii TaxID=206008 RepID=A0A2T8KRZ0_9POAL|nr:hypothetical protein PAHAL_2G384600 [Panicum hallii]